MIFFLARALPGPNNFYYYLLIEGLEHGVNEIPF